MSSNSTLDAPAAVANGKKDDKKDNDDVKNARSGLSRHTKSIRALRRHRTGLGLEMTRRSVLDALSHGGGIIESVTGAVKRKAGALMAPSCNNPSN